MMAETSNKANGGVTISGGVKLAGTAAKSTGGVKMAETSTAASSDAMMDCTTMPARGRSH